MRLTRRHAKQLRMKIDLDCDGGIDLREFVLNTAPALKEIFEQAKSSAVENDWVQLEIGSGDAGTGAGDEAGCSVDGHGRKKAGKGGHGKGEAAATVFYYNKREMLAQWEKPAVLATEESLHSDVREYLQRLLKLADKDGDGSLSAPEFELLTKHMGLKLSSNECLEMFMEMDDDGGGSITWPEFISEAPRIMRKLAHSRNAAGSAGWIELPSEGETAAAAGAGGDGEDSPMGARVGSDAVAARHAHGNGNADLGVVAEEAGNPLEVAAAIGSSPHRSQWFNQHTQQSVWLDVLQVAARAFAELELQEGSVYGTGHVTKKGLRQLLTLPPDGEQEKARGARRASVDVAAEIAAVTQATELVDGDLEALCQPQRADVAKGLRVSAECVEALLAHPDVQKKVKVDPFMQAADRADAEAKV